MYFWFPSQRGRTAPPTKGGKRKAAPPKGAKRPLERRGNAAPPHAFREQRGRNKSTPEKTRLTARCGPIRLDRPVCFRASIFFGSGGECESGCVYLSASVFVCLHLRLLQSHSHNHNHNNIFQTDTCDNEREYDIAQKNKEVPSSKFFNVS